MSDAALRSLEDRYHRLQDLETPTDKANRQRTERAQVKQQLATTEAQHQRGLQAARNEDMVRTKQHTKATKLIAKINKSTQKLTNALPEARGGGGGEVGNLSKHYNKAMKTMGSFIKDYAKSNPTYNSSWDTLPDRSKRELTYFHQSLSSNAHHRAINQFNTAKKHAEAAALESGVDNFRRKMTPANQRNIDGWMNHLDIPVVAHSGPSVPIARVIGTGGRKTRKRKRRRKTRKHRKKKKTRKRKHKKRHRRTRKKI